MKRQNVSIRNMNYAKRQKVSITDFNSNPIQRQELRGPNHNFNFEKRNLVMTRGRNSANLQYKALIDDCVLR